MGRVRASALRRIFLATVVAAVVGLPSQTVLAQDFNGIIGLMGRAIEQDMRERSYERQVQQHQQLRAAREQAQKAEERRQEIALVKRLQSALSKLGFYKAAIDGDIGPGTRAAIQRFATAFQVGQVGLTEEGIAQVEAYAWAGFRSRDETVRAARGGFENRSELLAGEMGGFATASDLHAAQELGLDSFDLYDEYRQSGFHTVSDFRAARKGGFTSAEEYRIAKASGFADRVEFDQFKRSGLPDRVAFEKERQRKAIVQKARELCRDGAAENLSEITKNCLAGIVLGAHDAAFSDALVSVGDRIGTELAKARQTTAASPGSEVASASTTGLSARASTDSRDFLRHLTELEALNRAYGCGHAFLLQEWTDAVHACGRSAADGFAHSDELKAEAARREEESRLQAEAERRKLALASANDHAAKLIGNLGDFAGSNGTLARPIPVAQALVQLKQVEGTNDYNAIEQAAIRLEGLLKSETAFQNFMADKQKAREIAEVNAKATAVADLKYGEAFVKEYVAQNILSEHVADLLALQKDISDALVSGGDLEILNQQKRAREEIARLGLTEALHVFRMSSEDDLKKKSVRPATNGLAVTSLNHALLEGDDKDILVLGNYSSFAPHLAMDLLGKTTFLGGAADYCWLGGQPDNSVMVNLAFAKLAPLGAQTLRDVGRCKPSVGMESDVILLQRGKFLQTDLMQARPVVDAFEKGSLKILAAVKWQDFGERSANDKKEAASIENDVMASLRKGYGILRLGNEAGKMCLVVPSADAQVQRQLLASRRSDLSLYFPRDPDKAVTALDVAFVGIQKNTCSSVYATAGDLKRLMQGLKQANITYEVIPLWFNDAEFSTVRKQLAQDEVALQKKVTHRQQEREAAHTLAMKQAADAERTRITAQSAMRSQYGEEAKAAFNGLTAMAEKYMREGEGREQFESLFPSVAHWKVGRDSEDWEVAEYDGELLDYGTAEWKGRRAETVFAEVQVKSKNRQKGEYADNCFVIGYLVDAEFGMLRDPFASTCDAAAPELAKWQAGRSFKSRWTIK